MKKLEMYQELMVAIAKLEKKIDQLLEIEARVKVLEAELDTRLKQKYYPYAGEMEESVFKTNAYEQKCAFENMKPEDRMKALGLVCYCKRCSPYALSSGSLTNPSAQQVWNRPSGDLSIE